MDKIIYTLLSVLTKLTSYIPFSVFYVFSDFCYIFLYRVFGYRKAVVRENLTNSFPEKSKQEIIAIERKFFRHLTDMFIESIKVFSMSEEEVIKRHKIVNAEIIDNLLKGNKSFIVVMGHYGNWEWGALSGPLQAPIKFAALYKRINNPYVDDFIKKNRSRTGTILESIRNTSRLFETYHDKGTAFLLVADQSPGRKHLKNSYWLNFLNQETPCLYGPEKYARKYDLPVIYLEINKIKRGYYTLSLEPLVNEPNKIGDGEITKRYMERLEKTIRKSPEYWLWSHRRWKRKKNT